MGVKGHTGRGQRSHDISRRGWGGSVELVMHRGVRGHVGHGGHVGCYEGRSEVTRGGQRSHGVGSEVTWHPTEGVVGVLSWGSTEGSGVTGGMGVTQGAMMGGQSSCGGSEVTWGSEVT